MRLEVLDFEGPTRWRFRLTDPGGAFLADQLVELDHGEWQFEAFTDLRRYLRWNAVPDRRLEHEAELVGGVGSGSRRGYSAISRRCWRGSARRCGWSCRRKRRRWGFCRGSWPG